MKVEIDDRSGFCFGVVRAIDLAERSLAERGGRVSSLGDIVHNRLEVERLGRLGLETVGHGELEELRGRTVLIRAHGEPPSTYETVRRLGLEMVDATCPVVASLQKKVVEAHRRMTEAGGQVVIFGRKGHAEVVGLSGQVSGGAPVIVVEGLEDLEEVDFTRPVYLLSQTTQGLGAFDGLSAEIRRRAQAEVQVHDTICRQVADREPRLLEFAERHDAVVFVSGRKSSNGRQLFGVCCSVNPCCYMVEDETELQREWFEHAQSVGICGATSTPRWLMERVAETIKT